MPVRKTLPLITPITLIPMMRWVAVDVTSVHPKNRDFNPNNLLASDLEARTGAKATTTL
jgi:hypothetical protein